MYVCICMYVCMYIYNTTDNKYYHYYYGSGPPAGARLPHAGDRDQPGAKTNHLSLYIYIYIFIYLCIYTYIIQYRNIVL